MSLMRQPFLPSLLLLAVLGIAGRAGAHFPFVVAQPDGAAATLVLSETLESDAAIKIERYADGLTLSVRDAAGTLTPLAPAAAQSHMTLKLPGGAGTRVVLGKWDFGVTQRGEGPAHLLVYYPKAVLGDAFDPKTLLGTDVAPVELVAARAEGGGVRFQFLVGGKPAVEQEVAVLAPGEDEARVKTDAEGLTKSFAKPGRYGVWARQWVDAKGTRGDKAYVQERRYATLVVDVGPATTAAAAAGDKGIDQRADAATKAHAAAAADAGVRWDATNVLQAKPYATLPEPAASFGAAAADGWLYVYGGHVAETHNYSTASISGRFHRLNLRNGNAGGDAKPAWESLPGGVAVQGMNLAVHNGAVYRVGGMQARNAPGEPKDTHSVADAARFDPSAGRWATLPPAPSARSSHDLAFVGDKLYALGGWDMKGKAGEDWLRHADVLDLSASPPTWTRVEQPFVRRALIAAVLGDDIYLIGGFDEHDEPQLEVDILNARDRTWRKGPPIPGHPRNGFAPAACTVQGTIYLSVASGDLFRLSDDRTKWEPHAKATPRIVHRLIPDGSQILIVGGADRKRMLDVIEAVPAAKPAAAAAPVEKAGQL